MSDDKGSEVPMVNVQIDGKWMQFPKGTRMIEAIKQAGTEVPHYCYHPKLSSPGNCRMCLVQMGMPPRLAPDQEPEKDEDGFVKIGWMPRPVISCANTVAENMGIRTDGPLVEECRKGVMEFLLINHPLDCPICDQAGECSLQEFSVDHGNGESRFLEQKVKKPKNVDLGPRIRLDDERCIMCSRCIRFSDEVAEDDVLGFIDRGSHTKLACHPGKKLENNYSLNTVDLCPVGALTSNDFRFQMRVWFLKETKSICTSCGRGCNMEIGAREGKVFRQTPRLNNEVNSEWMCDQGRLDFHYLNSESRLTDPLFKLSNDRHASTSWSANVRRAVEALKNYEEGDIAIVASARMTNEELFMVKKLGDALKVRFIDVVPRMGEADDFLIAADKNPNTKGAELLLGHAAGSKLSSLKGAITNGSVKALLVFDENLLKEAKFTEEHLDKLEFLLQAHILANPTASKADVVFPTTGAAEKRGSMINVTGRLQRLGQGATAPGYALDCWELARDLILGLTGANGIYMIEDVFKQMASEVPELEGLSLAKVGNQGVDLLKTDEVVPLLAKEAERKAKGIIVG